MHKKRNESPTLSRIKEEMNIPRMTKSARAGVLLEKHRLNAGLYQRVADKLGLDASYVRRVATGSRKSEHVMGLLLDELVLLQ